jgi:fluoride exporter
VLKWSAQADNSYHFSGGDSIVLNTIKDILVISIGAIFGANARWVISRYLAKVIDPFFPYGTLVINVSGSFIVGFFIIWATERTLLDPRWRLLIVVGFCGAFTTFSSFAFETMAYFEQGQWILMATNFVSNNLLCLLAALGGMALARAV